MNEVWPSCPPGEVWTPESGLFKHQRVSTPLLVKWQRQPAAAQMWGIRGGLIKLQYRPPRNLVCFVDSGGICLRVHFQSSTSWTGLQRLPQAVPLPPRNVPMLSRPHPPLPSPPSLAPQVSPTSWGCAPRVPQASSPLIVLPSSLPSPTPGAFNILDILESCTVITENGGELPRMSWERGSCATLLNDREQKRTLCVI